MIKLSEFKEWLEINTQYSKRTISNIVSRLKRADSMLEWYDDEVYLFRLEQIESYKGLSSAVKCQIKKAVKLYFDYIHSEIN